MQSKYSTELMRRHKKNTPQSLRKKNFTVSEGAYSTELMRNDKKKYSKKEYQKKNKVRKEPYKVEGKKISTKEGKNFCMARYHIGEAQKNSKSQKKSKEAKCQANTKRRKTKRT